MRVNTLFMSQYVHIEVQGHRRVIFLFEYNHRARTKWLKETLIDLGEFANATQRIYAPTGESGYLQGHLGRTGLNYHPGGPGGGGKYSMRVGIRRGTSAHPLYVHGGTANPAGQTAKSMVYGGTGEAQGRIYPKGGLTPQRMLRPAANKDSANPLRRPALTFQKRGEPRRFRAWVSGQRPQPFVYIAFMKTAVYAEGRVRTAAALFA